MTSADKPFDGHVADLTISEHLADWGAGLRPDDLPSAMETKLRDVLVDVVGLCLAARGTDYVQAALAAAEPGMHRVIGHDRTVAATSAALVNGTAAHGEDFDDTFEGGPVHSGAVIIPAVLAAAERNHLPAERIRLGIAAGLELLCRLGLTAPKAIHKAGFHPTAVLGSFAATFAVGVATAANARILRDALGLAGSMASGIIEYLGDGSWTKRMHPGWSAQAGLRAVWLAENGFVGPRAVFDGEHGFFRSFAPSITPRYDQLLGRLGDHWHAERIAFKPYPCGTMVQPYIDCAIALHESGVSLAGLRTIICETAEGIVHRLWTPLEQKQTPANAYAAKFSMPFGIALGLVRGRAGLDDFSDAAVGDEGLLEISRLVTFEIDPDNPYPDQFTGHVRLVYDDGKRIEQRQGFLRGGSDAPLTTADLDTKFLANARFGGVSDPAKLLAVAEAILNTPDVHRWIADLAVSE